MPKFNFTVTVDTDSLDHATHVIIARVAFDEPYEDANGEEFDYSVEWAYKPGELDTLDSILHDSRIHYTYKHGLGSWDVADVMEVIRAWLDGVTSFEEIGK